MSKTSMRAEGRSWLYASVLCAIVSTPLLAQTSATDSATAQQALDVARQELKAAAEKVAELSKVLGQESGPRIEIFRAASDPNRGRLGVALGSENGAPLKVMAVTPGGAAEAAGVKVGDELVAVDGKTVDQTQRDPVLAAGLGELKKDQKVVLTVRRDGKQQTIPVVANAGEWPRVMTFRNGGDGAFGWTAAGSPHKHTEVMVLGDGEHGDGHGQQIRVIMNRDINMQLVDIDPALGRYFSTTTGVLVAKHSGTHFAALRPGDVLLEVAGKPVGSAREAWAALYANTPGSEFSVAIMRDQRRQALSLIGVAAPELPGIPPLPPLPPVPPVAPVAPAPPVAPVPPDGPGLI